MRARLRPWVLVAGLYGAMAVGFAAYAAHGLAGDAYAQGLAERAWQMQLIHAAALLAASRLAAEDGSRAARIACWLFAVGVALFSGSLTLKMLSGPLPVPMVTPAGGIALLAGWLALAAAGLGL